MLRPHSNRLWRARLAAGLLVTAGLATAFGTREPGEADAARPRPTATVGPSATTPPELSRAPALDSQLLIVELTPLPSPTAATAAAVRPGSAPPTPVATLEPTPTATVEPTATVAPTVDPARLRRVASSAGAAVRREAQRGAGRELVWPTRGVITTYFGEVGPYSPRGHAGLDISAAWGSPVVAMDRGRVLVAGWDPYGYGIKVVVDHGAGRTTLYAHLARVDVEAGQRVAGGQRIGLLGSTGYSTGPHLHFEVRQDGVLRDPLRFLR
jgi:murein DD-endopeptidase MepM/ murein hydrolase activator NlpD